MNAHCLDDGWGINCKPAARCIGKCCHRVRYTYSGLLVLTTVSNKPGPLPDKRLTPNGFTGMQAAGLVDTFNSSTQQLTLFAPMDTGFQTPLPQVSFGMCAVCT